MHLPVELVDAVETSRRHFIASAGGLNHRQATFAPEGIWSIAQIVEHIVWSDLGMMVGTFRAWEDLKAGRGMRKADNPHHGMNLEEVIELTWDGPAKAPVTVQPKWGGPLSYWLAQLAANRQMLTEFVESIGEADVEDMVFPHGISGPVNVLQRIEFMRFHLDHHRAQIDALKALPDFPAA